jgi:hypothetical protein
MVIPKCAWISVPICNILVRIWISTTGLRIRIIVQLFLQWLTRCQQKQVFSSKFFCLFLTDGKFTFTSILQRKTSYYKITKTKTSMFSYFSSLFCSILGGSGPEPKITDPGGPKTYVSYASGSGRLAWRLPLSFQLCSRENSKKWEKDD